LLALWTLAGGADPSKVFAQQIVAQGPLVKKIEIQYVGPESISRERIMANLSTQVGQPFSQFTVEQDIRALYATGLISNVRIFAEPFGDGALVTVLVQGKPFIEEIFITGTEQIPDTRIRKEITSKIGEVLSEQKLEEDRQRIIKLYQDRNYTEVNVKTVIRENKKTNRVSVTFEIQEGPKLIVRDIEFIGNDSVLSRDLEKAMVTKRRNLLYFFNKSGRLLPNQVAEDVAAIRSLYQNRGFADVQIVDYQTQRLDDGTGVRVIVSIKEGLQYRVNKVTFEGCAAMKESQLHELLTMGDGALYTPNGLNADLKAIRDLYGTEGYVDLTILPEVLPAGHGAVNINYRLDEGVQSYVNLINIQGNTKTKDRVIRRELAIKPGEVFDTTLVDVSRQRLQNLNYFTRVETVPQDTLVPGRKDLNVIVEEKRTGSLNFGAGFSTIDSLVGFAEIQQTNFDLFNWPRFTGGGQRFRIRGQYGIQRSDFVIAFTEPYFLGYKLSLGLEGFYREATFLSKVYDQRNYGAAIQLRKPITNFLAAKAEYRIEGIEIYDVKTKEVGPEIREAAGKYTRSAVTGSLTWDSRDSLFLTRKGEFVELTGFVAGGGLGGTVQNYGISIEASKYWTPIWDLIFLIKGQIGVVDSWGASDNVPLFDRLYLGGANNLRGFDFREVGPKDKKGNPIGGNSLFAITGEVTFPIFSRVRGALFTDWGFVNAASWDYATKNFNGDIGIGVRLDLPIGPVRIDYGYPVKTDEWNGSSGKFNFNIGYQF
jgi:outer membrane protein insertion porin family